MDRNKIRQKPFRHMHTLVKLLCVCEMMAVCLLKMSYMVILYILYCGYGVSPCHAMPRHVTSMSLSPSGVYHFWCVALVLWNKYTQTNVSRMYINILSDFKSMKFIWLQRTISLSTMECVRLLFEPKLIYTHPFNVQDQRNHEFNRSLQNTA